MDEHHSAGGESWAIYNTYIQLGEGLTDLTYRHSTKTLRRSGVRVNGLYTASLGGVCFLLGTLFLLFLVLFFFFFS